MNFVGDALTFVHQLLNSFTLFKQALTVVYQLKDQLTITVKLGIPWTPEICESPCCFYVTTYSMRDQDMQEKHKTPIKIRLLPKVRTSGVWLVHFPQHKNLLQNISVLYVFYNMTQILINTEPMQCPHCVVHSVSLCGNILWLWSYSEYLKSK